MTRKMIRMAALRQMLITRRREMEDEVHRRLDAGQYGSCAECQQEITERRLGAMPFAVRCQTCEQRREETRARAGELAGRRESLSLFPEVMGP